MNILKQAQESDEIVIVAGSTGHGKVTAVDSLLDLAKYGHPGGRAVVVRVREHRTTARNRWLL